MLLRSICWNRVPMCAPSNCCLVIAVWPPPPVTCASRPPKFVPQRVLSICYLNPCHRNRNPLHPNISERGHRGSPQAGSRGRVPSLWRSLSPAAYRLLVPGPAPRHAPHPTLSHPPPRRPYPPLSSRLVPTQHLQL